MQTQTDEEANALSVNKEEDSIPPLEEFQNQSLLCSERKQNIHYPFFCDSCRDIEDNLQIMTNSQYYTMVQFITVDSTKTLFAPHFQKTKKKVLLSGYSTLGKSTFRTAFLKLFPNVSEDQIFTTNENVFMPSVQEYKIMEEEDAICFITTITSTYLVVHLDERERDKMNDKTPSEAIDYYLNKMKELNAKLIIK